MKRSDVNVVVVGSINYDVTFYLTAFPKPNETLTAKDYKTAIGGKGLNQAVAASRIGGKVTMIGCVGDDEFGRQAVAHLKRNGVDSTHIITSDEKPTGFATISVNDDGDNMISVAPGANRALVPEDIIRAQGVIEAADIVITQSEVGAEIVETTLDISAAAGVTSVFNPAPASASLLPLIGKAHYITPNESETETLTGFYPEGDQSVADAIAKFNSLGAQNIVITCGSRGSLIGEGNFARLVPSFLVKSVDSTGAGDVFNGVFAVEIARGSSTEQAVRTASAAAAVSVTRLTVDCAPTPSELKSFLDAQ